MIVRLEQLNDPKYILNGQEIILLRIHIEMTKTDGKSPCCLLIKPEVWFAFNGAFIDWNKNTTRFDLMKMENPSPIMLMVNTTDRFQGQEADVVFISLRNGGRIGFLNSPNRMNVALTRAREWRVIVGNHSYFSGQRGNMDDPMLQSLAARHRSSLESAKEEIEMMYN